MKYLETFAGIGGFRKAVEYLVQDTGIELNSVGFSEINTYSLSSYKANYHIDLQKEFEIHDINEFAATVENINKLDKFNLLLGGFPCQAFSIMGKQLGFDDERGKILFSMQQLIKRKKPSLILLENVRHIERHNGGGTLRQIIAFFKEMGYKYVETVVLDTQHFGLPQRRSRIFILCSRKKLRLDFTERAIIENFNNLDNHSLTMYNNVRDILKKQVDQKYYLSERIKHTILADGSKNFRSKSQIDLPIARTLTATMVKMHRACQDNYYSDSFIQNNNSNTNTPKEILYKTPIRRLTPEEALMLQGFGADFYENAIKAGVSEHQLYIQAGNALSVNTGYAIMHYLFVNKQIQGAL